MKRLLLLVVLLIAVAGFANPVRAQNGGYGYGGYGYGGYGYGGYGYGGYGYGGYPAYGYAYPNYGYRYPNINPYFNPAALGLQLNVPNHGYSGYPSGIGYGGYGIRHYQR